MIKRITIITLLYIPMLLACGCENPRPTLSIGGNHPCAKKINSGEIDCAWDKDKCQVTYTDKSVGLIDSPYTSVYTQQDWVFAYQSCVDEFNKMGYSHKDLETMLYRPAGFGLEYVLGPNEPITDWPTASWRINDTSQTDTSQINILPMSQREANSPPNIELSLCKQSVLNILHEDVYDLVSRDLRNKRAIELLTICGD